MKIAIVTPYAAYPGGVESANKNLQQVLESLGHQVEYVTADKKDNLPWWVKLERLVVGLPAVTAYRFRKQKKHFDIVFANGEFSYRIHHPRLVNLFHGCYFGYLEAMKETSTLLQRANLLRLAAIQRISAANAWRVYAVSGYIAGYLCKQGIAVHGVLHNGIDTQKFSPTSENRAGMLTVGNNYWGKGFDILERYLKFYPEVNISCVTNVECPSNMVHLPPIANSSMSSYYNRAKVFVLASRYEGMQLSPLEAMACGVPVIISDVGFASELKLQEPDFVLAVDDFSGEALMNRYLKICANYGYYANRARQLAVNDYSLTHYAKAVDAILFEAGEST